MIKSYQEKLSSVSNSEEAIVYRVLTIGLCNH